MSEMLKKYLYYRRREIALAVVSAAVFAASFALYRLPVSAVAYPAALCGVFLVIAAVLDYRKTKTKHERLERLLEQSAAMIERLPEPDSLQSEDLCALIWSLKDEARRLSDESEKREREIIDYYTVWAHQIKTPIAAMRLTLQGEDSPLSLRLGTELSGIERYVEMVLAYLRLGSVSTDYMFKEYDLDEIIRQALRKFAPEFIDRKLRLEYKPTKIRLVTDEKWLEFVIEQLLSNALKYTPEGSVYVHEENDCLIIKDEGIGISDEDLPRIFEKGFTGLNGRLDKKASGLGLYLCREICKNLSIDISVRSQPGKGTEAVLRLSQHRVEKD